jgi:phage tail sheath gpL-like
MATEIKFPAVNVPIIGSSNAIENSDQKVLFVGQKLAAGSALDGLTQNLPVAQSDVNALVGRGSMLQAMINDGRLENSICQFDMIVVPDGGGATAATATITLTGTATANGEIEVSIGSKRKNTLVVGVLDTSTETVAAAAIVAAITADSDSMVTAANVAGVVTLTSKNVGAIYNAIGVAANSAVEGIDVAVTAFSGGTVNPDLSSVLDAVGTDRYQTIIWGYDTGIDNLKDFLDSRFNAQDDVLDGVGLIAKEDTYANLLTLGDSYNSQSLTIAGIERGVGTTYADSFETPWSKISQFGAIRALRRQPDANIANYVISRNGALDSIGSPALSSKPYANTPMRLLPIIETNRGFDKLEVSDLNDSGIYVFGNNRAGNAVIVGEVVTTYKNDTAGNPDETYKFLNYVDTASAGREYISNNLEAAYAQTRLTDGELVGGRDMTNAEDIEAYITGLYQDLTGSDYVVARGGEANLQFFKNNINVTVDLLTGTVTAPFSLPIVTQLRRINAPMTLVFNI